MIKYSGYIVFCFVIAMVTIILSCKHEQLDPESIESGYPENIERIVVTKCATSGCHNDVSKEGAAGLSLETWDRMFEGGRAGATVIPYRPDFSTFIYYTNTFDDFGLIHLEPTMPYNADSLTYDEMQVLYEWVMSGAPNKNGLVKFADEPDRKKFYVTNSMCDVVTVLDAETMLAIRYVNIGVSESGIEMPRVVAVAPNNDFWGSCVVLGQYLQLFKTSDNSVYKQIDITPGGWSNLTFSSNSEFAYVADRTNGRIAIVDILNQSTQIVEGFFLPSGLALNADDDTLYVTSEQGNFIYKMEITNPNSFEQVSMNGLPSYTDSSLNIHQVIFSPDGSKYFITCEYSNEVRVINTSNDSLITVIQVGTLPQSMPVSNSLPYFLVSCTEDVTTFPGKRGSVYVIDYNTNQIITSIQAGHQSYGIAIDDENHRAYISNRNVKPDGPVPHHGAACSGKNGYISAIDLNTLQPIENYKAEVSVDPYSLCITH